MAILRQIAQLGQPVLRQEALAVADPAAPTVAALIEDMLVTMIDANGVGIAAPQVYEPLRLIIVASHPNSRYPKAPQMEATPMINPVILWKSEEMEKGWEGCLSIPGMRGLVPRHARVGIRYLDRDGRLCEGEYTGFQARIVQHEIDHLNGTVFLDRVESSRDLVTEKEYLRLVKAG